MKISRWTILNMFLKLYKKDIITKDQLILLIAGLDEIGNKEQKKNE